MVEIYNKLVMDLDVMGGASRLSSHTEAYDRARSELQLYGNYTRQLEIMLGLEICETVRKRVYNEKGT